MQGGRGGRGGRHPFFGMDDPFSGFGDFGGHRSLVSSFFGGRDPFEDPFFTNPFGGMFGSNIFGSPGRPFLGGNRFGYLQNQASQPSRSKGPIIEELNSDDEKKEEGAKKKNDNSRKHARSSKEPYIEDPDEEAEERKSKQMQVRDDFDRKCYIQSQSQPLAQSFTFQSSTVTYGGTNGAYYTSSQTRRTGSDGLTFEEIKQADSSTGVASHRISRGIQDKGHSVTRKLNSNGQVEAMQMLHNLNEDQLPCFEAAWKGNVRRHQTGWNEGFISLDGAVPGDEAQIGSANGSGWALPSPEVSQGSGGIIQNSIGGATVAHSDHSRMTTPRARDGTFARSRRANSYADSVRRHKEA